ncbi:hypothetical protein CPB85DRAFT_1404999 [Mucidula mucida]|nr:hypothetical protein CPB85DRAFT_1404999 [Mucidula mucida]
MASPIVYYGSVINPKDLESFVALNRCLLAVDAAGNIDWLVDDIEESMVQETMSSKGYIDVDVIPLKDSQFIIPGFIDTHTHAPQFANIGSGQQYELLDWLSKVTFPMEAKFADLEFARRAYTSVVRRVLDNGTTTCCYYGTLHLESTKLLADIIHSYGQRAFVGKCNMDRHCPDYYIEPSAESSIQATEALIAHIRSLAPASTVNALVQPILTPRFAISCTPPLLTALGKLASAHADVRIQTHVSENESEIAFTKELFPECSSYTHVYDSFGLLRHNTILAHAVHLEPEEIELISQRRAGISHCPNSNFNLSSGIAPIGELLDKGVKVGLGTDVSGGFSPSILNAIQNASIASKVLAMQHKGAKNLPGIFANRQFSVATLFYLATLGGAEVCDLDRRVGSFAEGKSFDALIIELADKSGNPGLWGSATDLTGHKGETALRAKLESFFFCGDDRNISSVFVQGRLVGGKTF